MCCEQLTADEFVEKWGSADYIAIDEVGGPGEVTDKFIAAWKKLKEQKSPMKTKATQAPLFSLFI